MAPYPGQENNKQTNNPPAKRTLGLFGLSMINIVAIASLRDLPQMAKYGWGSVFFYLLAALVFFFPVSLVAAELASAWPLRGGVYTWTKEAFGEQTGFTAVFLQWFQNLCWYPVVLTFAAASLAFAISPTGDTDGALHLAESKTFIIAVVLCAYWGATFLNFLGLKTSKMVSVVGAFCGVLIPGLLLVVMAGIYLYGGHPSHLPPVSESLFPDMSDFNNITFGVSVLLAFAGMEMTAVHAREVRKPGRNYPLGMAVATLVILATFISGALAIGVAIPAAEAGLQTGVTQALNVMLQDYRFAWLTRVVAFFMAVGVFGSINSWIIGPSKGMLASAEDRVLPKWLCHHNRHQVPVRILIIQAVIVSCLCLTFTLQPTVAASYFMLSDLTIQLYLIMYIIMFLAAIKLRYSQPGVPRPFKVPLGNIGMWMVAGLGTFGALFAIFVGFFPPSQFTSTEINPDVFTLFLIVGIIVVCLIPLVIYHFQRRTSRRSHNPKS